jgi:hypothetical protein
MNALLRTLEWLTVTSIVLFVICAIISIRWVWDDVKQEISELKAERRAERRKAKDADHIFTFWAERYSIEDPGTRQTH